MSNKFVDILHELDTGEEKRKADYTIWGYLYQFDLMLYDMLKQNTSEDMFKDVTCEVDAEYEVEMVEDYAKCFKFNEKQYIRIAQIKYHSQSFEFKDGEAIVFLYYEYLKYLKLKSINIDFKCALYYYNKKRENWDFKRVKEFLESSLKKFMKDEAGEETAIDGQDKSNKKKTDNLNIRAKTMIELMSNAEHVDKFVTEVVAVEWKEERQQLIKLIKEILILKHHDKFNNYLEKKGDVLYSLYIDYIINTWQKKKKRSERKKIKLSDIDRTISLLISNQDISNYQSIISTIRNYMSQILIDLNEILLLSHSEEEVSLIIKSYNLINQVLFENIKENFRNKRYRFSFLNTISMNEFIEFEQYNKLAVEREYDIFLENKGFICSYINRAMKFIYTHTFNNVDYKINFNDWFSIGNDFWLFKNPCEKRTVILFPKPHDKILLVHNRILIKLRKYEIRPEVWYFGEVESNRVYDLEIPKPDEEKKIQIDKPYKNTNFRIGCMRCLKEDEPQNIEHVKSILIDRCVKDDNEKH